MESEENNLITPVYLRERVGKTQMQLAVDLQRTISTIGNWERGSKLPVFESPEEIERVMAAYQCTFSEFAEAFKNSHIRISLKELKTFLEQTDLSFEEFKRKLT